MVAGSFTTPLPAADPPANVASNAVNNRDVQRALKGVEDRYNGAPTLQLAFSESYKLHGRERVEKGDLFLRKPGKMRWQYATPAGKLFISDGKFIYFYTPQDNHAEKMKFKETDDLRAPLAFLLGHLDFNKDFREFHARPEEGGIFITAIPKSDKLPYDEVSFLVAPDFAIRRLEVKGQDSSVLQFTFENERKGPPLQDALFTFTPPPGTEYVDSSKQP
jgi:outer membrane lipoprotein carrier protein